MHDKQVVYISRTLGAKTFWGTGCVNYIYGRMLEFILYTIMVMYFTGVLIHAPITSSPLRVLLWPVFWFEFISQRDRAEELRRLLMEGIIEAIEVEELDEQELEAEIKSRAKRAKNS